MGNQLTKAELDTLYADNTTRNISPAKLRDLVESACIPHGALNYTDPGSATTISTPSTYTKLANVATLDLGGKFSMPSLGRLQYDGAKLVHGLVHVDMTVVAASSNQVLAFALFKNGSIVTQSVQKVKALVAGDVFHHALHCVTDLNPGDYLEIFVSNETSATNVTVQHAYLSALGILH